MKILLTTLNAKYIHSNLALRYLYAAAKDYQDSLQILEFTINNDDDHIFVELMRNKYDAVCFSCYIWNRDRTLQLIENLKKADPSLQILIGGPEVSFDIAKLMAEHKGIDFVIEGEGETVFSDWLREMHRPESDFKGITGLNFRKEGKIQTNPERPPQDFQNVAFPYDHLKLEADKIIYYESVRGCPYRCSYCLSSLSKGIRPLPVERVKAELLQFISNKVPQVKFIDRTFNWNPARCSDLVEFLIENDNGVTNFHLELCGDLIDAPLISLISRARKGLFQLEIGVQSTNSNTLEASNRVSDFQQLARNVEKIQKTDQTHIHLDLIAGLPLEDFASFRKSFNDVYHLRPNHLQLGFLKLLQGSAIREQAQDHGYIYRKKAPYEVISNRYLSSADIVMLKMIENVLDLYYNRGGFENTLNDAARKLELTPFDFYQRFAWFYYDNGYQDRSHKKEDLYRIFHHFVQEAGWLEEIQRAEIREMLLLDRNNTLNPEAVKNFEKNGWSIQKENTV